MKFSQLDVVSKENDLLANRKDVDGVGMIGRLINNIIYPRNPKYTFNFYVPHYIFIRSAAFCDDVAEEIQGKFDQSDLADVLFTDFLEYAKKKNDLHDLHTRLKTRDLSPATIKHYNTDQVHGGVIFEEFRGFELVNIRIDHKTALRGEFILRDMLDIYPEHEFILEHVLEIVYCDFVDDYRKGIIKNPIEKITQYL